MPNVTVPELKSLLVEAHRGAMPVTLVTETVPQMYPPWVLRGGNPYWGRLTKLAKREGMVGVNYERAVNRERLKEEQPADEHGAVEYFQALPPAWGEIDPDCNLFLNYNGHSYLRFCPKKGRDGRPVVPIVQYRTTDTHEVIPEVLVQPLLILPHHPVRQQVDSPVYWRTPRLDHIKQLTMNHQIYTVV